MWQSFGRCGHHTSPAMLRWVAWVGWSEVSGLAEVVSVGGRLRASDLSVELLA